jgi:YfiH family protein
MLRRKSGKIEWLEFELLQEFPQIKHGVFLRHGGVSNGPFSSLNAGSSGKDNTGNPARNRELIRDVLKLSSIVICEQPHKANVAFLPQVREGELDTCDGMITNRPGIGLMTRHADCQAALFFDPVTSTIASVHSGWRGNVQNIYGATVEKMEKATGAKRENIRVCVSPSLGPDRSEFINYRTELPESFWPFQVRPTYFDLWEIGKMQLLDAGILPNHIQFAKICTYDNPDDFFSFRRDKRVTGGHGTVISLV